MKNGYLLFFMLCLVWSGRLAYGVGFDHHALKEEFDQADASDGSSDGYAVSLTSAVCARCHQAEIDEIIDTVHYTFRSDNPKIEYPGGGKHGHYDRGSGITGGTTAVNYTYDNERGCGRCHVGKYLPGSVNEIDLLTGQPTPNLDIVRDGIDCLICHASTYTGRDALILETAADGQTRPVWRQDRSWEAVASIGKPFTEHCLRCHREAASPDERGTPFADWNDVHIASTRFGRNACTVCHRVKRHKMPRGNYVSELFSSDFPVGSDENAVLCERCHSTAPHAGRRELNAHVDKIACQTCHIPWTSGITYARWEPDGRRLAFSRADRYSAQDSQLYEIDGMTERDAWERYKMRPKYLWFNGESSYLAQPFGNKNDGISKIWPFKPLSSGLPLDDSGMRMVDLLDDATMQRALIGTGAMRGVADPEASAISGVGTIGNRTSDSSLSATMQREMLETPLVLNINLQKLSESNNLGDAVSAAMQQSIVTLNFVGRILGAENDSPLVTLFDGVYPGNGYRVEKIPTGENVQAVLGPGYPSGSYLTLTHGVRKAAEALTCRDCHSKQGVLKKNRFEVFVGRDAAGAPKFKEATNSEVLGYGKSGLRGHE